ncbi:hypothetical protein L207DRAFT_576736 [Hyaloscypha variabilis F]|uniref:Myb-like domain-containing protein n=1 Tax=Hyaloscypha variabilis (strain UAMH 11265 / GT02V1 / F) TaxID=1149755 RepID=A0A2J6SB34_HYAVF|nr:hypothetical protein L207DRAFT_576736 [Hyaloscypha variabilis F]
MSERRAGTWSEKEDLSLLLQVLHLGTSVKKENLRVPGRSRRAVGGRLRFLKRKAAQEVARISGGGGANAIIAHNARNGKKKPEKPKNPARPGTPKKEEEEEEEEEKEEKEEKEEESEDDWLALGKRKRRDLSDEELEPYDPYLANDEEEA